MVLQERPHRSLHGRAKILLGVVTAAVITVLAPTSSASASPAVSAETGNLVKGATITRADGVKVVLPKDWAAMSINDLAAIGIRPGQVSADAAKAGLSTTSVQYAGFLAKGNPSPSRASALSPVVPASASGCNGFVCIYVEGSHLRMDAWNTKGVANGGTETYSVWWKGYNTIWLVGNGVYVPSSGVVWSHLVAIAMPHTFPAPVQLCNTWQGISGKPCINIKA